MVLDDLVGPPMPPVAVRAWQVFADLSGTRSGGMGGIAAISYTEMVAYQTMTGTRLTPLDVALVREADGAFLAIAMRRMQDTHPAPDVPDLPDADEE